MSTPWPVAHRKQKSHPFQQTPKEITVGDSHVIQ